MKVKLLDVSGTDDFDDMIGGFGDLVINGNMGHFNCLGNDWVEFRVRDVKRDGVSVVVETELDNVFVFECAEKKYMDDVLHRLQDVAGELKSMGYESASDRILEVVEQVAGLAGV